MQYTESLRHERVTEPGRDNLHVGSSEEVIA